MRLLSLLLLALPFALAGCPDPDDDDTEASDDDDAVDDDDATDDDDAVDDDDATDDDDAVQVGSCSSSASTAQGMDFVCIDGGTFDMGCTAGQIPDRCRPDESPVHNVTLTDPVWFATTEVTVGAWSTLIGNSPTQFPKCGADCPAMTLSWWEAAGFANAVSAAEGLAACYDLTGCTGTLGAGMVCTAATITAATGSVYDCEGYRLPTEAEFEYAARGGQDLPYPGSSDADAVAWHSLNSGGSPHAVATKDPNAFGLYDMAGNASEYMNDWYGDTYYAASPAVNPEGLATGTLRSFRGGGWGMLPSQFRCSARLGATGDNTTWQDTGLRLVRTDL